MAYLARFDGGEGWERYETLAELEDQLFIECKNLVDLCEQEINQGGTFEDSAQGDAARAEYVDLLWDDIVHQLLSQTHELEDEHGSLTVKYNPRYAVDQREAFNVTIQRKA